MLGFELERRQQVILLLFLGTLVFAAGIGYARYFLTEHPPVVVESSPSSPAVQNESKMLYVHVVGAVQQPGVYQLPAGARLFNALEKASPLPEADLAVLNLAAPLSDGQQVYVPRQGEIALEKERLTAGGMSNRGTATATGSGNYPAEVGSGALSAAEKTGRLNLNTASEKELDERLPGIGPALAKRIVEYREQHGGFRSPEELKNVSGIGEKRYEQIKDLITVY